MSTCTPHPRGFAFDDGRKIQIWIGKDGNGSE